MKKSLKCKSEVGRQHTTFTAFLVGMICPLMQVHFLFDLF